MKPHTLPHRLLPLLLLLSIVPAAGAAAEDSAGADSPIDISKVSFLIHPVCWDLALAEGGRVRPDFRYQSFTYRGGAWYDEQEFYEILEWERRVNRKQKEYIRAMGPDEALIIYPIGNRPAMQALENAGAGTAGAPLPDHPLAEPLGQPQGGLSPTASRRGENRAAGRPAGGRPPQQRHLERPGAGSHLLQPHDRAGNRAGVPEATASGRSQYCRGRGLRRGLRTVRHHLEGHGGRLSRMVPAH